MKLFVKILVFLCITFLMLAAINLIYSKKINQIIIGKTSYVIRAKNTQFDYVVAGSSRVDSNFNPIVFDSLANVNGFNIGCDGSALCENYLTLYLFLKNGNKTKNYLLQVEDNYLMDPQKAFTYPFHDYYFLSNLGEPEVDNCFKSSVPVLKYYIWKYIPFVKYAEFNNYYGLNKLMNAPKLDQRILALKGYNRLGLKHKNKFPLKVYPAISEEIPVDESNIYYLNKIKELCSKNDINFIIYSSPVYQPSYVAYQSKNLHKALTNYVTENKIPYFNFMTDQLYSGDSLFYDETHLNAMGTDIFTKQLVDSLRGKLKIE